MAESNGQIAWQANRTGLYREGTERSWMAFVAHYTKCSFTYESDRLVAIEGLARLWMKSPDDDST